MTDSPLRHTLKALTLILVMMVLAGCRGGSSQHIKSGSARAVATSQSLPAPDTTSASGAYTGVSDYRIGPLDLLEVSVFQIQDLSRTVRVNSSGQISLPLIGMVEAGGKTVSELEGVIAAKLTDGYLQNPQVTVFVKEFTSQRITVEGAVNEPGIYPITGRTTLLQAVAMAKGLDRIANLEGVIVFRTIEGKKMAAVFDFKAIRAGNAEDPQIYGDDIIVVDESGPRAAWRDILQSLPFFNTFRPY